MKSLLAEYLRNILEQGDVLDTILTYKDSQGKEQNVTARSVQKAGKDHPAWPQLQQLLGQSKQVGTEKPTATGVKEPTTPGTQKPQQQTPQAVTSGPQQILNTVKASLNKIASTLTSLRNKGVAGPGGAVASHGEATYASFSSSLQRNGGFIGMLGEARVKPEFEELVNEHAENEVGGRLTRDKTQVKRRKKLREAVASDFGWKDYNDDDPEHRKKIGEYLALRERFVDEKLKQAKEACENKEEHVFCKGGSNGYGQNEKAFTDWLEAAFDGGARLDSHIRMGGTRLDPTKPWSILQSDGSSGAIEGGYSPEVEILSSLEQLRDAATSDEDRLHYEKQIELFNKFSYHDTFAVGTDRQGRLSVVHISNKKSSDMNDPHFSSTPEARLLKLRFAYENDPEMASAAEDMVALLDEQLENVRDIKLATSRAATDLEITDEMLALVMSPHMKKYTDELDKQAARTNRGSFGRWLSDNDMNWDEMSWEEGLKAAQQYMKQTPSASFGAFGYFFVKLGELAKNGRVLTDVFGTNDVGGLGGVIQLKDDTADSVNSTYRAVVSGLRTRDKDEGHTPPPPNGRHAQTYIDGVMSSLHLDTYIDNYDQDFVNSMGAHAVTPKEVRQTLMRVLPEEFTSTIDIETPEGKQALKKYLRENCEIDATTGAIVVSTPDGKCSIGEDSWRTAGKTPKVSTSFGSCFRQELREETSKKPVDFLQ